MELTEQIARLLEEKYASDEAFHDCFTVEIELKPGNKLNVFIDADSGIDFDKCRLASRYLESYIDANGWLGEKYTLEVSSPGLSRPLKFIRQYRKNIGRTLDVTLLDKNQHTGTLKAVEEDKITITHTAVERDGKKKKEIEVETVIPVAEIEKALVKPAF
jgi:ribosome maturation factor RimP